MREDIFSKVWLQTSKSFKVITKDHDVQISQDKQIAFDKILPFSPIIAEKFVYGFGSYLLDDKRKHQLSLLNLGAGFIYQ